MFCQNKLLLLQRIMSMKKFFVTNLVFLLSLNILIKSFWILGVDRGMQNALPAGDYGFYYALLNFTYLFNIVLDLGITSFNNRTIAQNSVLLSKYFAKIIPLKFILALVYAAVVFVAALISGYDSKAFHLLLWLCVFQVATSILVYLRSNISALMLFKTDSLLSVMDKTITIILCSILLWSPWFKDKISIDTFVYIQTFSIVVTMLTALIICLVKTGFVRIDWDKRFMMAVLKYGFPFALLALLMSFYNRMDSVMLERILKDGGVQSGIYASAFRLVDSVNMVAYLFSVILLPLFSKMIKEKKDIREIIKISFNILLVITSGFVIVSVIYSADLMQLMYNKHILQSSEVYKILCFCFIPVSMTYIFGTLLTANNSLKQLNIVAACGMIINILINLLLIPKYQAFGSAISALMAQSLTCVAQVIIALRIFKIKVPLNYCIRIILFLLTIIFIALLINKVNIFWIYKIILSLGVFVIMAFCYKIFDVKELKNYIINDIITKNR